MGAINSFIPQVLQRLPNWIINIGALVVILLFAVLATSPKMITGTVFCTTLEGERCQKLSINGNFEGRDVRTLVTDGTGTFHVPLYDSFSAQSVSLYLVKNQVELRVNHLVTFDIMPVWAGRQFTVHLEEKEPGKFSAPKIEQSGGNWLGALVGLAGMLEPVSTASAQEIMTYDQLLSRKKVENAQHVDSLPSIALPGEEQKKIEAAVEEAYGKATEQSPRLDDASDSLRVFTPQELSDFNADIKLQTGVAIPATHWQFIETKNEATQYLKSLKGLQLQYPDIIGSDTTNWSKIEQEFQLKTGGTLVVAPSGAIN